MEAITSRPLLLHAVGRMVTTGRRKIIRLTSTLAMSDQIRRALNRIGQFLTRLARTAEQLERAQRDSTALFRLIRFLALPGDFFFVASLCASFVDPVPRR
jgi:hypothetical protein